MAAPTWTNVDTTLNGEAPLSASITPTATGVGTVTVTVDWGDGNTTVANSGVAQTNTYTNPGAWTITLTAEDSNGDTATLTRYAVAELVDDLADLDGGTALCGADWFTSASDVWCCDLPDDTDDTALDDIIDVAIRLINDATCRKYAGVCSGTIRPPVSSYCVGGTLSHTRAARAYTDRLDLTEIINQPIRSIDEVVVDGEVIDPLFYSLANRRWLIPRSLDGVDSPLDPWPLQHLERPAGVEGTWYVTVTYGQEPPPPLVIAAATLACEMFKQCLGTECGLPDGATSITREGVSFQFPLPDTRRTGLRMVDMALDRYECKRPRNQGRIFDPAAEMQSLTRN